MLKHISFIIFAACLVVTTLLSSWFFENNQSGYVQVHQSFLTGDLTVITAPGPYWQGFGTVTTYKISDAYDYQENVRFNDASTATITGQIKYTLPLKEDEILRIHREFRSQDAVHLQLVKQTIAAALRQSATYFRAEEVYSTRRADFIELVNDQVDEGIYATTYREQFTKDEDGNTKMVRAVNAKVGPDGKLEVAEESSFRVYNVRRIQNPINDIDFDERTDALINERKAAEQNQVVAKANAERAKQDAITAYEQGRADVAKAEAAALVLKKQAVVNAEKETEVAIQKALQAESEKKAVIAKGQAEAEASRLKVAAGLSPLDRAMIDKDTAIGVAQHLAQVKLPQIMIIGGEEKGENGGKVDPFTVVGLESFIRMSKSMSEAK